MKIVHELNQLDFGGVERVIRNIIKYDDTNKHSVMAYKDGPFRKELESVGANIVMMDNENGVEMEADLIHIHSGGSYSRMALELGKGFPIIETIHSPVRSPMRNDIIRQRIGVTSAVSKLNHNCITILNGIDLETLVPSESPEIIKQKLGISKGLPIIGRLGRIGRDKGLEDWLLTCHYIQQQGIDFIPLVVGGEATNEPGYMGKVKLMAECLPVKNIVFAGHQDKIADYLQLMDIFLYPSLTEGFGLVYAEAMYMGSTVVAYENDVTKEVCAGYSVLTKQNIPALIEGTKKALNQNMRDHIGPIAHDYVKQDLNAMIMAGKYKEIYGRYN